MYQRYNNSMSPFSMSNCKMLMAREIGTKTHPGYADLLAKKIYTSIDAGSPDPDVQKYVGTHGGIFNLQYSLDGRTLVAACEHNAVILFDAANQTPYKTIPDAHIGCVNCVKYLDSRTFATGSDDNSIKLWDVRNLTKPVRNLLGHTNWVKNLEYLEKERILVSSAFDGCIFAWDIDSKTEHGLLYTHLFVLNGLMRTKITNDGSKMILSTSNGHMLIIHNLDVSVLASDIGVYKPTLYRQLNQGGPSCPSSSMFSYPFCQTRTRNRIELIDDFPYKPDVISSLELHPLGWCAVSRSINGDETEEWTTVHDIQGRSDRLYDDAYKIVESDSHEVMVENNSRSRDMWFGSVSRDDYNLHRAQQMLANDETSTSMPIPTTPSDFVIHSGNHNSCFKYKDRIFLNVPRLTHYIVEQNTAEGFIKEQSFSHDGRVICSPYGRGVRLLGFNERLQELAYCIPKRPSVLYTITEMCNYHSDSVVSCSFSPNHYQMVSGCLNGELVWYKPIF